MAARHRGLTVGGQRIEPGTRRTLELPVASLYSHAPMTLPVHVVCGRRTGPRLFVCAAIHGDEINGVEIIRRLLRLPLLHGLRGGLLAVPIVNVYGFVNRSRYLPDRRDLNRSFPGSSRGSMAARLADLFLREIVHQSDYGIDLHTGAVHRENLPQVRADLDNPLTARLARAFRVPVLLNAVMRDGSLREAAAEHGIPILVYEAGEALRFDERSIRAGLRGIVSVMRELNMLPRQSRRRAPVEPVLARASYWVRAPHSGILRATTGLGARLDKNGLLGYIADPFGEQETPILAPQAGIVIGRLNLPLVNEGDALFHLAQFSSQRVAEEVVETFQQEVTPTTDPLLQEEPPIV